MKKRVCPYCKQEFTPDRFHPDQVVCSFLPCQRLRRNEYHRKKIAIDPVYRDVCADSQSFWKEQNPDYQKQYRARSKSGKTVAHKPESALEEVRRLLRHAKNTAAKNNSALTVTRCFVEVLWVAAADASAAKNNIARAKVVVFQGDPNSAG